MAFVAAGCAKEQDFQETAPFQPGTGKLVVETAADIDTKVTISKDGSVYKMAWDGDEAAKLVQRSDAAANASLYASSTIDVTAGKAAFTFTGLAPVAGTTKYNYDILYPASAVGEATGKVIAMTMPAAQTPGLTSADPAACLLAGRNASDFDVQPASVNAPFGHLAAYVKMRVKNGSYTSGVTKITSMTITAEGCNIAGALAYDAETGVADYTSGSASTIVLDGANLEPAYAGYDVWFACKPFTLPAGSTFTVVTETTDKGTQTATLTAGADVTFAAGKVTELPVYGISYTVTFNTNGGSTIGPIQVGRGAKVKVPPTDPTKTGALAAGLYEGEIADPDNVPMAFGGWYSDSECTTPFDFDTQIFGNTTIYAKWTETIMPVDMSGFTPTDAGKASDIVWLAVDYLNGQTSLAAETNYTIVVGANNAYQQQLKLNNAKVVATLTGVGSERTLSHNWGGSIINAAKGHVILSKNITLTGNFGTSDEGAVYLSGGNVTMKAGSKITGCSASGRASAAYNNSGDSTFTLDGGEISNNTTTVPSAKAYGGAMCANWGTFIIKSGRVINNVTTTDNGNNTIGGAGSFPIYNRGNAFQKTGGIISGNSASYTGGATGTEVGQQLIIGNHGRIKESGIYKVDANLGESDNLETYDRTTNPLWIEVVAPGS